MRKLKLTFGVILGGIAALVLMLSTLYVLHSGPRPLCHRALDGAFQNWMYETGHTNVYPNANGLGRNSLEMIKPYFDPDIQRYRYVPGLSYDDPKDLVLMYMQTRYTWHGDNSHTVFSPLRWLVLSPDIVNSGTCPEGGNLVDTSEFKRRLLLTLRFLQENQRPYWQIVSNEQMQFLKSIND